jgi:hypothetical protein
MTKEDSLLTFSFHVSEDTLQPRELIAWVREDFPEVPVHVVACLSSHSKDSRIVKELFVCLTFKLEILGIISSLSKCLNSLLIEPEIPHCCQILNHVVLWAREILDIDREDVMIALQREYHELISEGVLDLLGNDIVDIGDFLV